MNVITELPNNILQTEKGKLKINASFDVVLEIQKL